MITWKDISALTAFLVTGVARRAGNYVLLFSNALLVVVATGVVYAEDGHRSTVIDSGYEGESLISDSVAWIDSDRVLFTGFGPLSGPRLPDRYNNKALYVWNVRSGEIKKYAALGRSSGFCLASGVIRYWFERQESLVERFGRLGEESERVYSPEERKKRSSWWLNKLTCKWHMPEDIPRGEGVFFRPLRDKDGYLGGSVDMKKSMTIYLPNEGGQYVTLPIPERTTAIGYSEFLGLYVLRETPALAARKEDMPMRFWLFTSQRTRVEPLLIPSGPWMKGSIIFVMPVQTGFAFTSHATGNPDRDGRPTAGAGGLYFLIDGKPKNVISGYPYSASVSPDGCKVGVNIVSRFGAGQLPSIKFTDFCVKER